jgi:hypothetical protein
MFWMQIQQFAFALLYQQLWLPEGRSTHPKAEHNHAQEPRLFIGHLTYRVKRQPNYGTERTQRPQWRFLAFQPG